MEKQNSDFPIDDNSGSQPPMLPLVAGDIERDYGNMNMQALRSASNWSLGRKNTEYSIYQCYQELIEQSQRFIYIENQFFISSLSETGVENKIVQTLFERIRRAIKEGSPFKVVVFMPLMPAFEANLEDHEGKVMQLQIALQNLTIGKGKGSLIERIKAELVGTNLQPESFIQFCSLRKWEFRPSDKKPISEIIYIHSKLMIVDDQVLVMGSANLNDRSMLGSRDSEIAVCIDGPLDTQADTGFGPFPVCKKIHEFRRSLFQEHYGVDIPFPTHPQAWQTMWQIVNTNTQLYERIFKVYPSNLYPSFNSLQARNKDFDQQLFDSQSRQICGHAVIYPYHFLKDEDLMAAKNSELSLLIVPIYALF